MNSRTHKKRLTAAIITIGMLALAGTAYASTSNTFGSGGTPPTLNADCSHGKIYLTPIDGTVQSLKHFTVGGFTITQTVLKCEHRRINRLIRCFANPVPNPVPVVAEAPADAQGFHDTQGLAALRSYVALLQLHQVAVQACVLNVTGVR